MARRNRKHPAPSTEPAAAPPEVVAETAPEEAAPVATPAQERGKQTVRRVLLTVMLSVFALFMITVVSLFRSGESIQWKKELLIIDNKFAEGAKAEAAKELEEFGTRWPDARKTVPWNEKAGRYFSAAGDWKKGAEYFEQAVNLDNEAVKARRVAGPTGRIRALAGEAYFHAGDAERAAAMLSAEIREINRAVGDHDRAHYYLGLLAEKDGAVDLTVGHFQAIANPEPWKTEIDRFYAELESKYLAPAREAAAQQSLQQILATTNPTRDP